MQNDNTNNDLDLLSIGDASEYLGISIDTLRRWEKRGRIIPMRSPGGHRYFNKKDLEDLFGKRYTRDEENSSDTPLPTVENSTVQTNVITNQSTPSPEQNVHNISNFANIQPLNQSQSSTPIGLPSWRAMTQEKSEEVVIENNDKGVLVTDTKIQKDMFFTDNNDIPQMPPSVLSRPIREVKIPEISQVRILSERQVAIRDEKTEDKLADKAQEFIKQQSASILTPLEVSKNDTPLAPKVEYQTVKKDVVSAQSSADKDSKAEIQMSKNQSKKLVAFMLIFIGLVLGSIAWYYAWNASQIILSPVP